MPVCARCGQDNPDVARFCLACGAPLTAPVTNAREERKVVTVLFCDLVGFTAASDHADPEDVRARLRPYHAALRAEIERFGGTVEKFIGDAVMAVFGAPVAHEDDPERAVRSGLGILDAIRGLNEGAGRSDLHVRIGINTGEALVALDAHPEEGEGIVSGDVVNTASRLQGAAPVDGIVVSEPTYRATERVFTYEALPPVMVKGKAEPLAIWRPLAARARLGADLTRTHATPLVGRTLEKQLLIGTFRRAAEQRSCQLVTIVGEPGVGKSRLCTELLQYVDDRSELVRWRQGRCLPYGEPIAFWALGEIVKAECGILESDTPAEAAAKLDGTLTADDAERAWLRARLEPLVGAGGEPAARDESFMAWRRFLETLAAAGPTVLVFEDVHWADEALLAFIEHVADWSSGVPLLLVCTARPELYERHPAWGAGLRNATAIALSPLSEEETARLIASLLERSMLSPDTSRSLLERAGGNPLYAEEYVRLLSDRDVGPAGVEEVPESLHALIAARLDTLSPDHKHLLQDAAVIGKVFWAGALRDMGSRERRDVDMALHELSRKELVRPSRTSSISGDDEFGFWHAVVRDVCYSQIPRAARAARHRAAAEWIERQAGERVEDLADVLAHHYTTALELTRAAGRVADADELISRARRFLTLAGERALALDVGRAEVAFATALELTPADDPDRADLLESWAEAAMQQNRLVEARAALEEAARLFETRGAPVRAGRALATLSSLLGRLADPAQWATIERALSLIEAEAPGPELVAAYAELAARHAIGASYREAIAAAERSLALARELGLAEPARAVGYRGTARCSLGERGGLDDLRRALTSAVEQGQGRAAATVHNNLALAVWEYEGPVAAIERCDDGIEFCERRGIAELGLWIAGMRLTFLAEAGRGDEALRQAASLAERAEAVGAAWGEPRSVQLRLLWARGELDDDAELAESLTATARQTREAQMVAVSFSTAARVLTALDQPDRGGALLEELFEVPSIGQDPYFISALPDMVRCALDLGDLTLATRLAALADAATPMAQHVLVTCRAELAEASGDLAGAAALFEDAERRWEEFGNVQERAFALLGLGRSLRALARTSAESALVQAREILSKLGYRPALREAEALLARGSHLAVREAPFSGT